MEQPSTIQGYDCGPHSYSSNRQGLFHSRVYFLIFERLADVQSDLFGEQARALFREMHVPWPLDRIEPFENERVQVVYGDLVLLYHSQSYVVVSLRIA